jgi:hypothetical protein
LETWYLQQKIAKIVEDDLKNADIQTQTFAMPILSDLKLAMDNNLIPPSMLNDQDLSAFGNYLLFGKQPTKNYTLKKLNGEEFFPIDYKKLDEFQKMDAALQKIKADRKSAATSTGAPTQTPTTPKSTLIKKVE